MDSSGSHESQPEQIETLTETITCMDPLVYDYAAKGKIVYYKQQSFSAILTPNKNTLLHIYITAFNSGSESRTNFVETILDKCPLLLRQANAKGETPLHIAARYGHADIVEVLIKYAETPRGKDPEGGIDERVKEMLRMTNKEKDTALHEAVRYNHHNHLKVVKLLISKDPDFFSYSANDAGETPLYIAAERGFKDALFEILEKCKSPDIAAARGPLGRTALHVAVIRNDEGMTEILLKKIEGLSREVDGDGWTPLHFAAYLDHSGLVNMLLDKDQYYRSNVVSVPYTAYMKNKEDMTPLHIAAQRGHVGIVKSIVLRCPDCCELVDNRGWNVLHYAMKADLPDDVIDFFVENSSLSNLLNEKTADGHTPLHFYSNSQAIAINFVNHPRVDKMAFNKENLSAYELASTNSKLPVKKLLGGRYAQPLRVITCEDDRPKQENQEAGKSQMQKAADNSLVVAALITTVSFAACITMPGGFVGEEGSHPGSALLSKNIAFKAFVITDTISMVLSSTAVFINLWMPAFLNLDAEDRDYLLKLSLEFIMAAMVAMGLAFVTGTFAVLAPSSLNLAIANCIVGLTFFASLFHVCRKFIWTLTKRLNRVTNVKYK